MSKNAEIWNDLQIPARVFFDVLHTSDLQKLKKTEGKASEAELLEAWDGLFDSYYEAKNDGTMKQVMRSQKKMLVLYRKIGQLRQYLHILAFTPIPPEELKNLDFEGLAKLGCKIDPEGDILAQIKRHLDTTIPQMETQYRLEKAALDSLTSGERQSFEDNCVVIEGFGYKVDENVTLGRYIAYERAIEKKARMYANG
mgnify:CR=1 FL=1